jgi:hypothetical protein
VSIAALGVVVVFGLAAEQGDATTAKVEER